MNLHSRKTRFFISFTVLVALLFLIIPHAMDVDPPLFVVALLKPAELVIGLIRSARGPCTNVAGSAERPLCEATPVDLLMGLGIIFLCILLYSVIVYFSLPFLSRSSRQDQETIQDEE